MRKTMLTIIAVLMIGIISWLIGNVFGRTIHPRHVQMRAWNGQLVVMKRSDPAKVLE